MATQNTNLSNYNKATLPDAKNFRFGIVVSEWNSQVTEGLLNGALAALSDCGVDASNVKVINVIGSVIKGETQHFDFVCDGVTQGIKDLNVLNDVPVVFCVLTDNNLQQSIDRSGGKHGNKGVEAAITAIKMVHLKNTL